MVLHDYELKVPIHGLIVVGEGEVRSNCATSMMSGALRFFVESLQCSFLAGLAQSLGIATLQVRVRVSVPALSERQPRRQGTRA